MSTIRLVLATLAVFAATANADILTGCDDCRSPTTALRYAQVYLGGSQYRAYTVNSNGYIQFVSSTSSSVTGLSYNPRPISQTEGSAFVAGFWADVNLACAGTPNRIEYSETCDSSVLLSVRTAAGDGSFNPTSAVVAKYEGVQRYSCPASCETNNFQIIVANDPASCRSYAILRYDSMGWNTATYSSANQPTVGYSNGQCQGYQLPFPSGETPAAYLQRCRQFVYRIDQSFGQVNRGNLALAQDKALAMYGPGGEKAVVMYGPDTGAVMQDFPEKNVETMAMEDKLSIALQAIH